MPKLIESSPEIDETFSAFMMFEAEDLVRETEKELLQDEPIVIHWELNAPVPENSKNTDEKPGKTTVENEKLLLRKYEQYGT